MIRSIFVMMFFMPGAASLYAQSNAGIYLSVRDYYDGRLSYQQEEEVGKYAIRSDRAFNRNELTVTDGKNHITLHKGDIFGYRDKKNQDYRFYNDVKYKIVDPSYFHLYSREMNVVSGKMKTRETKYFFSAEADSPIYELTIANLKKVYPGKHEFHDFLDLQFRHNKQLTWYDKTSKRYKLKSVFERTVSRII